jgi:predicted transcriptional regulator
MSLHRTRIQDNRCRLQRDRHDEIVAIVTANPGISIGQIRQQLPSTESRTLVGTLTQLCMDKRIEYRPVNCYVPVLED